MKTERSSWGRGVQKQAAIVYCNRRRREKVTLGLPVEWVNLTQQSLCAADWFRSEPTGRNQQLKAQGGVHIYLLWRGVRPLDALLRPYLSLECLVSPWKAEYSQTTSGLGWNKPTCPQMKSKCCYRTKLGSGDPAAAPITEGFQVPAYRVTLWPLVLQRGQYSQRKSLKSRWGQNISVPKHPDMQLGKN